MRRLEEVAASGRDSGAGAEEWQSREHLRMSWERRASGRLLKHTLRGIRRGLPLEGEGARGCQRRRCGSWCKEYCLLTSSSSLPQSSHAFSSPVAYLVSANTVATHLPTPTLSALMPGCVGAFGVEVSMSEASVWGRSVPNYHTMLIKALHKTMLRLVGDFLLG